MPILILGKSRCSSVMLEQRLFSYLRIWAWKGGEWKGGVISWKEKNTKSFQKSYHIEINKEN
jgi:hypothetical protein